MLLPKSICWSWPSDAPEAEYERVGEPWKFSQPWREISFLELVSVFSKTRKIALSNL